MSKTKVFTVDSIRLSSASVTGRVTIEAAGTVRTTGWTGGELVDTRDAPKDGNRHLDFVATKPDGITLPTTSPIEAGRTIQTGAGQFCVIVHAETNSEGPKCITVQIGDPP